MLLAFDLDKTIVTNDHQLPLEIANAILEAKAKGHKVSILTGRPTVATTPFLNILGVSEYFSTNHGVFVVGKVGEVLQHKLIETEQVNEIINPYSDYPDLEFACIVEDTLYVKTPSDERWAWAHTINRHVKKFDKKHDLRADKIVFIGKGKNPEFLNEISENNSQYVRYLWDNTYLEITCPNADKGSALKLIADEQGIAAKDIIAFGDGPNDLTMLEYAQTGIAVGPHATPEVISAANEHIESPENLGVAKWLKENL
ncbi:MAG TPA: Cof-type HAD-IIB family hydrolase [Trueperaceae bacterium]|nr:Cof-type HAD-IIB family hydrolase [Trueperaceae bacterium]